MKRFIEGQDRSQSTLFPESLEEYIDEDNAVRVVDAYVDELDLFGMGFERVNPKATGRPGYHPSILLKLYIYGYLNRIQSSRRLEREAGRNVELMWLTGKLAPDFKTIADFRKDNGPAIQTACSQFVILCRELGLFARTMVAIDGAKFKAVNAREKNFTKGKLTRRIGQVAQSIERYLQSLDATDLQEGDAALEKTERLKEKILAMREKMTELQDLKDELIASPEKQISLTDPDSRAMATSTKAGMVGYNVQTVVDTEHHLIVAHEVTNIVSDKVQLTKMTRQGQAAIGRKDIEVFADLVVTLVGMRSWRQKLWARSHMSPNPIPQTHAKLAALANMILFISLRIIVINVRRDKRCRTASHQLSTVKTCKFTGLTAVRSVLSKLSARRANKGALNVGPMKTSLMLC